MSLRSLHVNTSANWRGGEQQVLYLLRGLRDRGHHAELAAPIRGVLARRALAEGFRVHPFSSCGDLDLPAAWRLRRLLGSSDLLHLHTGHAHALGLLATLARNPAPAVIVSRRVDFPIKGGKFGGLKYSRGVDRFLPISQRVRDVLLAGGVDPARITTVYSGVASERFEGGGDGLDLRRELNVPQHVKLIGFVGALVPHKAPGDLLEALAQLPREVHAVLAGDGELASTLQERAGAEDLTGRVHFLGHREDIPGLLSSLDVFCLPSRMEGLGTAVLDAMAAGIPIVATTGGGIPEMVEPDRSGILVPPAAPDSLARALAAVLSDPFLAARLSAGGRVRVQAFSADRMVEGTMSVYTSVLRERRGLPAPHLAPKPEAGTAPALTHVGPVSWEERVEKGVTSR